MAEVYLNGKFVGTIESGQRYVQQLVEKRRKGELPINCNAYYNQKTDTVEVENEKGRLRRPLIVVKDGQPLLTAHHISQLESSELTFADLVKQGVVEYLDAAEEENALV